MFNLLEVRIVTDYQLEYIDGDVTFNTDHRAYTNQGEEYLLDDPEKIEQLIQATRNIIKSIAKEPGMKVYTDEDSPEPEWVKEQAKNRTESSKGTVEVRYLIDCDNGNAEVERLTTEAYPITFPYYIIFEYLIHLYADLEGLEYIQALFRLAVQNHCKKAVEQKDVQAIDDLIQFCEDLLEDEDENENN